MKNQSSMLVISGLLLFSSSYAFAGVSASEDNFMKLINTNIEQKREAEAKKYYRVVALAGDKRGQLDAKNDEVVSAYQKWVDLKSAAASSNSDALKFKAVEAGARYAQVRKEFVEMQKGILLKSSSNVTVAEAINALNATAPSAAGR